MAAKSRWERRMKRYTSLKKMGEKTAPDTLFISEIKKLRKKGYIVEEQGLHPKRSGFYSCIVHFPKETKS